MHRIDGGNAHKRPIQSVHAADNQDKQRRLRQVHRGRKGSNCGEILPDEQGKNCGRKREYTANREKLDIDQSYENIKSCANMRSFLYYNSQSQRNILHLLSLPSFSFLSDFIIFRAFSFISGGIFFSISLIVFMPFSLKSCSLSFHIR